MSLQSSFMLMRNKWNKRNSESEALLTESLSLISQKEFTTIEYSKDQFNRTQIIDTIKIPGFRDQQYRSNYEALLSSAGKEDIEPLHNSK